MSPRTDKQNREIRKKMELTIIESALALFAEDGYIGTSMQSIAKKANVSKGNLYNYFDSKQALLEGVLIYGLNQIAETFGAKEAKITTEQEFEIAIKENFKLIKSNKVFWKLYYNLFAQPKVQSLFSKIFEPFIEQYIKVFESYFIKKGERRPKEIALLLGSALDGVSLGYLMMGEEYPLDEIVNQLIKKFK